MAVIAALVLLVAGLAWAPAPAAATTGDEAQVWASAAACREVVESRGGRMAPGAGPARLRVGAWNIEWFPDRTDIGWLACAIAWMNLDLLGVVEIRDSAAARAGLARLTAELERLTAAPWRVDLQRCGEATSQHVGFLWNRHRLSLVAADDVWPLNARAHGPDDPCAGWLRPGRHAHFVPASGDGPGFHAIVVHLKSGATPAAAAERTRALERLDEATRALGADGERVVLLGDFNTMGDGRPGSGEAEVRRLAALASASASGLRPPPAAPACTEYYRGKGGLLDHVLTSAALGRVEPAQSRVTGYCAVAGCAPIYPWRGEALPAAYRSLSDHCPVVVETAAEMLSQLRE